VLDHDLARESAQVDQRVAAIARAGTASRLESELEALRTESRALVSRYQEANAYAAAQAAFGRVMNSLGIDLLPGEVRSAELPDLQLAIDEALNAGEREAFATGAAEVPAPRQLRIKVSGLDSDDTVTAVGKALERTLKRAQVGLTESWDAPLLTLTLRPPPAAGGRPAWQVALSEAGGGEVFSTDYASVLPVAAGSSTVAAFAEAAVLSVLPRLREALAAPAPSR
ncbi:MAG: TolC family protein, partial [Betaproteobacteria bacterium]